MDHHELYEEARRVTRVYARMAGVDIDAPAHQVQAAVASGSHVSVVPGRVYVLMMNTMVLGVYVQRDTAQQELFSLMAHYSATPWTELITDQLWRDDTGRLLSMEAHDVR